MLEGAVSFLKLAVGIMGVDVDIQQGKDKLTIDFKNFELHESDRLTLKAKGFMVIPLLLTYSCAVDEDGGAGGMTPRETPRGGGNSNGKPQDDDDNASLSSWNVVDQLETVPIEVFVHLSCRGTNDAILDPDVKWLRDELARQIPILEKEYEIVQRKHEERMKRLVKQREVEIRKILEAKKKEEEAYQEQQRRLASWYEEEQKRLAELHKRREAGEDVEEEERGRTRRTLSPVRAGALALQVVNSSMMG